MSNQVDPQGVPMDDSEYNDPSQDANAPDPLLGEEPKSGAIATSGIQGARNRATSRYDEANNEMQSLKSQYADTSKQQSDAYALQKKTLEDATQRLIGMQAGPSAQESRLRLAAAYAAPGVNGFNAAGVNNARADAMQQQREAEMQKAALIAQYQGQVPSAIIGQTNARLGQLTQQQRIVAGQLNNSNNTMAKPPQNKIVGKYYTTDPSNPDGPPIFQQGLYDTDMAAQRQKAQQASDIHEKAKQSEVGIIPPEVVEQVRTTGTLPSGFSRNPVMVLKAYNMAHDASVAKGDDVNATLMKQRASQAAKPALATVAKQQAMIESFEETAGKNANLALQSSAAVDRTGVPVFNKWLQAGRTNVEGSPEASQFNAYNNAFVSEYGKIMSGAMGNAATSDSTAAHAREVLNTAMTQKQYAATVQALLTEMGNRRESLRNQHQSLLDQMAGGSNAGTQPNTPAPPPAAQPATGGNPVTDWYLAAAKARSSGAPPPPKPPGMQ